LSLLLLCSVLTAAEARRSISSERVSLVGSEDIINALRALNQAIWRIEWFARGLIDNADIDAWRQASDEYHAQSTVFKNSHVETCGCQEFTFPGRIVRHSLSRTRSDGTEDGVAAYRPLNNHGQAGGTASRMTRFVLD
jgi:hypothetical protein